LGAEWDIWWGKGGRNPHGRCKPGGNGSRKQKKAENRGREGREESTFLAGFSPFKTSHSIKLPPTYKEIGRLKMNFLYHFTFTATR
jgi:hypothetical protein